MDGYEERIRAQAGLRDSPTSAGIEGPRAISQSSLERRFEEASLRVDDRDSGTGPPMSKDEIEEAYRTRAEAFDKGAGFVGARVDYGEALAKVRTSRVETNPEDVLKKAHRDVKDQ